MWFFVTDVDGKITNKQTVNNISDYFGTLYQFLFESPAETSIFMANV